MEEVKEEELHPLELIVEQADQFFTPKNRKQRLRLKNKNIELVRLVNWSVSMTNKHCSIALFLIDKDVFLLSVSGIIATFFIKRLVQILKQGLAIASSANPKLIIDTRKVYNLPLNSRKRILSVIESGEFHFSSVSLVPSGSVFTIYSSFLKNHDAGWDITCFKRIDEAVYSLVSGEHDSEGIKVQSEFDPSEGELYDLVHKLGWHDFKAHHTLSDFQQFPKQNTLSSVIRQVGFDIHEKVVELQRSNEELEKKASTHIEFSAENEANLVSLIENTNDLIHSVDQELNVLVANSAFKDFMRRTRKINIREGKNIFEAYTEEEIEFWEPYYKRALEGRSSKTIKEEHILGARYSFEISFNPILKSENQITGVTVFIKDITSQQEAEHQLKQQNEELLKVNNELDRFVYSVSHDLRAPLSSILGLINLARMEGLAEPHGKYYQMIEKSIKKLDDFIGDIINYSRNARLEINKESIWFNEFIPEIYGRLKAVQFNYEVERKIEINQSIPFISDKERLGIIVENLVSNAIRYQRKEEQSRFVLTKVDVRPEKAIVEVRDNGEGVSDQHQKRIFDMFFRASEKTTGSGLGLYIVKESVKKLGGELSLTSVEGEGSTFRIEIPNLGAISRAR